MTVFSTNGTIYHPLISQAGWNRCNPSIYLSIFTVTIYLSRSSRRQSTISPVAGSFHLCTSVDNAKVTIHHLISQAGGIDVIYPSIYLVWPARCKLPPATRETAVLFSPILVPSTFREQEQTSQDPR